MKTARLKICGPRQLRLLFSSNVRDGECVEARKALTETQTSWRHAVFSQLFLCFAAARIQRGSQQLAVRLGNKCTSMGDMKAGFKEYSYFAGSLYLCGRGVPNSVATHVYHMDRGLLSVALKACTPKIPSPRNSI